jgi:hypothetical protein
MTMSDSLIPDVHALDPHAETPQQVLVAATHHDPENAMLPQTQRVLPLLLDLFGSIVVLGSPSTGTRTADMLTDSDIHFVRQQTDASIDRLGIVRLDSVRLAAQREGGSILRCDWDRLLHWAEMYLDELREVVAALPRFDVLVLGRTPRAFATHPRVQRDTETLANHAFGLAFGQSLDVTAGAIGLSRRAAEKLLAVDTPEQTVGTDCAWPLYLSHFPELVLGYTAAEGLEWETPDRHVDQINAAGGLDAWIAAFDANLQEWELRVQLAMHEVAAVNRWRQRS